MPKIGWNKTKVNYSTDKHHSLRTTVPIAFANLIGLEKGDILKWNFREGDNVKYLTVEVVNGNNL